MSAAFASSNIHIVLTFDDNFWAPAYAVMRSICLFTKRRGDLVFHLCHRTLSPEHRRDLEAIAAEFGARQVWYDLDRSELFADIARRMPYNKRLTNIVYARLIIDQLVDPSIERVLYLDCDILVRAPIENLYEIDLDDHPIAAARDTLGPFIVGGRDLRNNRDLFDIADPYFNAGVILIDLARWRDARLLERLETMLADGTMERIYYDQDFLNLVFKHDWLRLAPAWNVIDARHAHEGLDLNIMHYTAEQKPWHLVSSVAFRRIYRHVMTNELFYRYLRHRVKRRLLRLVGR
jgi:lipopolysaccharide biosynthesis glycosyltransferase